MRVFRTSLYLFVFSASCVLQGQSLTYNIKIQELCDMVDEENISLTLADLCWANGYQSRVTFTPGNYYAAEYIAQFFESLPGISTVVRDTFYLSTATYPYNGYPIINVSATLEGSEPDSGYILLGAHYDASGNHEGDWDTNWQNIRAQGADDNATGVAGVMEVARVLSNPASNFINKKTIKFVAFGAEEYHPTHPNYHHIGSLFDAEATQKNNENLQATIILDMFGYNPLSEYVEVISDNPSLWLADQVYQAISLYTPSLETNSTPADVPYSDHDSYQKYGFPSILLMENDRPWNNQLPDYQANPFYHSIGDSISTLNLSLITKVIKSALASIAHFSGSNEITSITESHDSNASEQLRFTVYPNPSNSQTTFQIDLAQALNLSIDIFNATGQMVGSLAKNIFYESGVHSISWNTNHLASGLYFVSLSGNNYYKNFKLIIIK